MNVGMRVNTPVERLEIAKLARFRIVGEAIDHPQYGMPPNWVRIAQTSEVKLGKFLAKVSYPVNVYIMAGYDGKEYITGKTFTWGTLPRHFKEVIERDSSAINLLTFGFGNDRQFFRENNVIPPTPWMLMHRLGHILINLGRPSPHWIFTYLQDLYDPYDEHDDVDALVFMQEAFTFRSARMNKMNSEGEGFIDWIVQTLKDGEANLRIPEKALTKKGVVLNLRGPGGDAAVEKIRKEMIETMNKFVDIALQRAAGKYLLI